MALPRTYPLTRYEASPLVDLTDKAVRERLSGGALRAFFNIMERWEARDEDARALLGGISNGPYYELKKNPVRVLDADRLQRISYLVGIFKALHILYSEALADAWVTRPNTNRIFGGISPLEFMVRGGLPSFAIVRRLLDARRGGQH